MILTHETVHWDTQEQAEIAREDFARGSRLGTDRLMITFDPDGLRDELRGLLVTKGFLTEHQARALNDLGHLHRFVPDSARVLDHDEINAVSRAFYDTSEAFVYFYHRLVRHTVDQLSVGDCVFQATPTVRFHFPNQTGFDWKPRFHCDPMLGHPPQEINIWAPLCAVSGNASMRLMSLRHSLYELTFPTSKPLTDRFAEFARMAQVSPTIQEWCAGHSKSVDLAYGSLIAFDPRCLHATQFNDTERTRVSLDFRVMPVADYDALRMTYRGTGRRRMPFTRGAYYHEKTIGEVNL